MNVLCCVVLGERERGEVRDYEESEGSEWGRIF